MLKIIQIAIPLLMAFSGILQTIIYVVFKRSFNKWPLVAAKIDDAWLIDQLDPSGKEILEAIVIFSYNFRGVTYESRTPLLKGYDLFPSREYESNLIKKYKIGEYYNARVHPAEPEIAYLEIAPLSKLSTFLAPVMTIGGMALIVAYFYGTFAYLTESW